MKMFQNRKRYGSMRDSKADYGNGPLEKDAFQNRKRYGSMRDSGICRGRRNAKKIALLESVSRRTIFYCVFRQN